MGAALDYFKAQREHDYKDPQNNTDFDDLQASLYNKLINIDLTSIVASKIDYVDYHDISEAVKGCEVEFETLINALAHDIAKRKLE